MSDNSYWGGHGKYQKLAERLHKLIPSEGAVEDNDALELFRLVANIYYDLHNNGLANVENKLPPLKEMMKEFKTALTAKMGDENYELVYYCWSSYNSGMYETARETEYNYSDDDGHFPEWDDNLGWFTERLELAFESLVDASVEIASTALDQTPFGRTTKLDH